MQIGYLGLGDMGGALARRLMMSQPLVVFDLNQASLDRFAALGAQIAATPADLARRCDVVMICVPRSANVTDRVSSALTASSRVYRRQGRSRSDQRRPNETRQWRQAEKPVSRC